jgi:hypothetical protein
MLPGLRGWGLISALIGNWHTRYIPLNRQLSRDVLACSTDLGQENLDGVPNPCGRIRMSSLTAGKHASSGAASNLPAVAEPTFAERARTLVYLGRVGSLSTLSRKQQGFPFGSMMPYGLDDRANPVFLTIGDPLGASRVTLLGNILKGTCVGGG